MIYFKCSEFLIAVGLAVIPSALLHSSPTRPTVANARACDLGPVGGLGPDSTFALIEGCRRRTESDESSMQPPGRPLITPCERWYDRDHLWARMACEDGFESVVDEEILTQEIPDTQTPN